MVERKQNIYGDLETLRPQQPPPLPPRERKSSSKNLPTPQ